VTGGVAGATKSVRGNPCLTAMLDAIGWSNAMESRSKRFAPDPNYRLSVADAARLASWVDRGAAEYLLSGLSPKERELWLSEILCAYPPGAAGHSPVQEIQPVGDVELDRAIWGLYSEAREWRGGDESFPFPKP
jgi:hypothetical protein